MVRTELVNARGKRKQSEVARDTGISQKYISKLELGKGNPSLKIALTLSGYYKKSVEKLFPDLFPTSNSHKSSI